MKVELVFRGLGLAARMREHAKRLVRRGAFMLFLPVALVAIVRFSGVDDDGALTRYALGLGLSMIALVVTSSSLAVLVARMPDRVVTFDDDTIHERVGAKTTERTWQWVTGVTEDPTRLELELRPDSHRSLRLTPTKPGRLLLEKAKLDPASLANVRELLRARGLL